MPHMPCGSTSPTTPSWLRTSGTWAARPGSLQLYCEPGAADDVLATWRERVDTRAWVLSRDEAVGHGLFGAVSAHVLPRIGDVIVAMRDNFAIVDSRTARPKLLALLGLHGSLTPAEMAVPLLQVPARDIAPGR